MKTPDKEDLRTLSEIAIRVWGDKNTLLRSDAEFVDQFTDDPNELTLVTLARLLGNDTDIIEYCAKVMERTDHSNQAEVDEMYRNHARQHMAIDMWIVKLRHEKESVR